MKTLSKLMIFVLIASCSDGRAIRKVGNTANEQNLGTGPSVKSSNQDRPPVYTPIPQSAASSTEGVSQSGVGTRSSDANITDIETSDSVDKPVVVTGAFLHCMKVSEVDSAIELGCRIDDTNGDRVKTSALAASIVYSYVAPVTSDLTVNLEYIQPKNRIYDVLITYKSPSVESTRAAIGKTEISAVMNTPVDPLLPAAFKASVSDVLVPAPPQSENFAIYKNNLNTQVVDRVSGKTYVRLVNKPSSNWTDANADCKRDGTNRELPYFNDLQLLLAHGVLNDATAVAALKLVPNSQVWMQALDEANAWKVKLWDSSPTGASCEVVPKSMVLEQPLCFTR